MPLVMPTTALGLGRRRNICAPNSQLGYSCMKTLLHPLPQSSTKLFGANQETSNAQQLGSKQQFV